MTARQNLKGCVSKMNSQDTAALKSIADHYGEESQLIKLQEECGELWGAIHDFVKDGYELPDYDHVCEEIADVLLMVEQIVYLLDAEDDVSTQKTRKIERQLERIRNEKNE